jgi:rRNA processing protein Gar1
LTASKPQGRLGYGGGRVFEEETTIAWQATPRHAPVVDAQGEEIGSVAAVLGDEGEDIFHGVALKRKHDGDTVEIPAVRIKRVTAGHVITDLAPGDVGSLQPYDVS